MKIHASWEKRTRKETEKSFSRARAKEGAGGGGARAAVTCKPSVPAAALHLSVAQGGGGALVGSQKTAGQREDYENGLCDNSARELAEALKTNTALTTLNLRDNSIGDEGAVALAEALKVRT